LKQEELPMGILSKIGKPADRPVIVTICGDSGMGKTTLAATFPKPIVIRAEDGLQAIPASHRPDAFPVLPDTTELWEQLKGLINEEHDYKTLIIDSVTALERMFAQHVVETDPKGPRGIQQALGGYGAGRDAVASMHARIRKAAGVLADKKGMNTVFIAHADTQKIEPPDDDAYMRYTLRLHEKSMPAYVDDVDVVGFLKLETFTTGDGEKKKAISDGTRILICHATAANVSKNRYGISEALPVQLGANPLAQFIPSLNTTTHHKAKDKVND
jgi:AAA domain